MSTTQKSTQQRFTKGVSYVIGTLTKRAMTNDPKFTWQRTFLGEHLIERGIKTISDLIKNDKTVEPFDPAQTYYVYEARNGVLFYYAQFSPMVRQIQNTHYVPNLSLSDDSQQQSPMMPQPDMYFNHTVNAQKENAKSFDRMCSLLEKQVESLQAQMNNLENRKNQDIQLILSQKEDEIDRLTQSYDNQITVLENHIMKRDKTIAELNERIIALNNDVFLEREKLKAAITLQEAKDFVKSKEKETQETFERKLQKKKKNMSSGNGGLSGLTESVPMVLSIIEQAKNIFSGSGNNNTGQIEMKGISDKPKPRAIVGQQPPTVNRMSPPMPQKTEEKVEVAQ